MGLPWRANKMLWTCCQIVDLRFWAVFVFEYFYPTWLTVLELELMCISYIKQYPFHIAPNMWPPHGATWAYLRLILLSILNAKFENFLVVIGLVWVGMFIICTCIPRNTQPVAMVSLWTGPLWFCSDWKWAYLKDLWDTWCLEIDGLLLQSKIIIAIVPWFFWFHFRAVVGTLCMSGNVGTLGSSH